MVNRANSVQGNWDASRKKTRGFWDQGIAQSKCMVRTPAEATPKSPLNVFRLPRKAKGGKTGDNRKKKQWYRGPVRGLCWFRCARCLSREGKGREGKVGVAMSHIAKG